MKESIKELRKKCYMYDYLPLFFERIYIKVLRVISIYFTKVCLVLGISANQATFISLFLGIAGCLFFIKGTYLNSIIGAVLLQFMQVFDSVDGEIARYNKTAGPKGWFIDSIPHKIIQPLMFICIAFGLYKTYNSMWVFILAFLISTSILIRENTIMTGHYIFFETLMRGEREKRIDMKVGGGEEGKLKPSKLMRLLKKIYDLVGVFFSFPTMQNVIFIAAIFNILNIIFIIYGIALPLIILVSFYYECNFFVERLKNRSKRILK